MEASRSRPLARRSSRNAAGRGTLVIIGRRSRPLERAVWGAVALVITLAIWQGLAWSEIFITYALPSPRAVGDVLWESVSSGDVFTQLRVSLGRLLVGSLLGIATGVVVGLGVATNRTIAASMVPLLTFFNALGGIVWIPVAILWFGVGPAAITFVIWNSVFFQVVFNTVSGVQLVPAVYRNAVRTMGGGRLRVVWSVLLPGALPSIVNGVRVGMSFGWRTLIAAEMIGATTGIGVYILGASQFFRSDQILAGIIAIGVVWLITDRVLLRPLEAYTVGRWRGTAGG